MKPPKKQVKLKTHPIEYQHNRMKIIPNSPTITKILSSHRSDLGADFAQYKNHVYRVFNFAVVKTKTAEAFRLADLTDLTFGLFHRNCNMKFVKNVRQCFHNEGFHINLLKLFLINLMKHPLNPLPMYKW